MFNQLRWVVKEITGHWPKRNKPKPRRVEVVRDEHFLSWIRLWPCCVCEAADRRQLEPTEAAHLGDHGVSEKAGDDCVVPLCGRCHRTLHKMGLEEFQYANFMELMVIAKGLYSKYLEWVERQYDRKGIWK